MTELQGALQFGGLGALALFAWLLLKSMLKEKREVLSVLNNHLTEILEQQRAITQALKDMEVAFSGHVKREEEYFKAIRELYKRNPDEPAT